MGKLVRDKIPEIIKDNNQIPVTRILGKDEHFKELLKKLLEEAEEVTEADNDGNLQEEIADLLEVIHAVVKQKGFSIEEIEKIRLKKKEERGGFEDGIYLESVEG